LTAVLRVDPENPDPESIARAADALRRGELVAFPTETVYGLGAHALDRNAVRRVFDAKERPANDPLIVHVASLGGMAPLVEQIPATARALADRFWPGPLTIVLPKSHRVPDEVTAGLPSVAVRVPSHAVARAILEAARIPVAAPSANLFSRPSPTRAAHVLADLEGRVDLIVDAGPTHVGVESTVLDLSGDVPVLLRPGAIDLAALRAVIPDVVVRESRAVGDEAMASPGLLSKHYAPRAPLTLYDGDRTAALSRMTRDVRELVGSGRNVTALVFAEDTRDVAPTGARIIELSSVRDPAAVAARLYAALRESDESGPDAIVARTLTTDHPLTAAINDRLRRAASGRVVSGT
jgi:L-threonylcarbamoyladenylate synthase